MHKIPILLYHRVISYFLLLISLFPLFSSFLIILPLGFFLFLLFLFIYSLFLNLLLIDLNNLHLMFLFLNQHIFLYLLIYLLIVKNKHLYNDLLNKCQSEIQNFMLLKLVYL